jgi:hypothetical protein
MVRKRGRPKGAVPFLQNPKRYYVMFLRGTRAVMPPPPSIRRASKVIAALMFGNEIDAKCGSSTPKECDTIAKMDYEAQQIMSAHMADVSNDRESALKDQCK